MEKQFTLLSVFIVTVFEMKIQAKYINLYFKNLSKASIEKELFLFSGVWSRYCDINIYSVVYWPPCQV